MIIISIPAYNEEKTLPAVLRDINKVMRGHGKKFKILVWDDGSTDKTSQVAKKLGAIVKRSSRNRGLAETFRLELKECIKQNADIIVHTDADGQYPAKFIPSLIEKINEGNDLVLGSRFQGNNYSGPILKKIGNIMFSKTLTSLTKIRISDSTTGFRAFTKEVAKEINIINRFTYTQEQIIKAAKQNFKIGEISISTKKTRESRLFKSPIQYAFKAWVNIFRIYRDYNPLKFFGTLGTLIFILGVVLGFYFVYLHFTSGIDGHMGLFFLLLILIMTGLQIIMFGFLADMMRVER